jgi:hypothetical protein
MSVGVWLAAIAVQVAPATAALNRPDDPIVMTGAAIPLLQGIAPSELVAFRWSSGWDQVPVQVDERRLIDINEAYDSNISDGTPGYTCASSSCFAQPPNGVQYVNYTDPDTWVGPDSNLNLDADDEVALMARDTGSRRVGLSGPVGVLGQGIEIKVTDPLDAGVGYVYLFRQNGSLDPAAGEQYVDYNFNLLSGNYKTTYRRNGGTPPGALGNPEASTVVTSHYTRGFTDRFNDNELRVQRGSATGVDILDRHDGQFAGIDGTCVRTQTTFKNGEGAFIANKSGPVRAIRDFIGANSGPQVQRRHVFYEGREDISTHLRVHAIPGVTDFFDYSSAASGMLMRNTFNNGADLLINGVPDTYTPGSGTSGVNYWEQLNGAQGGLSIVNEYVTNNPNPSYTTAYRDEAPASPSCGGDGSLYGASGPRSGEPLSSTDEANGASTRLFARRTLYYEEPGQANGAARLQADANPLTLSVRVLPAGYARPKAATPINIRLVPAFEECTSSNANHGAPLAVPSCNPPVPSSDYVTVGTPEANGKPANLAGVVKLKVVGESPIDPDNGDQADIEITISLTDIRNQGDLSDYTGELRAVFGLRITDSYNGELVDDPATAADASIPIVVPCSSTAGSEGAACNLATTADAAMSDVTREGQRALWELGEARVYDGGSDGDADTTGDNTLFAVQGLFAP